MTERKPDGYSEPVEFEESIVGPLVLGLGTLIPLGPLAFFTTAKASYYTIVGLTESVQSRVGLEVQIAFILSFVAIALLLIEIGFLVVILHEMLHYGMERAFGYEPELVWADSLLIKDPSIMIFGSGINPKERIPVALAPLVCIGVISAIAIPFTDGFLQGVFVWILLTNTGSSASDLWLSYELWRMPNGTIINNYRDANGEPTSDVLYPDE